MTYYLSDYQTFDSVQEMDHHVNMYRNELNATQFRVLWLVSNYAVKYPGAAHLKAATIAEALGVSTKTVYRALSALVDAGALIKHVQYRPKSGGQGATIYSVQPHVSSREQDDKPTESSVKLHKSVKESAIPFNQKSTILDTAEVPTSAFADSIPANIYEAITLYFSNAKEVYKYYGIILRAKSSVDRTVLIENDPEPFVNSWHRVVYEWKRGKIRKSFDALLYSAMQSATTTTIRRQVVREGKFDWLT